VLGVTNGEDERSATTEEVAAIEARRTHHGMPVNKLAERAGADRSYLADVLKGKRPASATFLGKVSAALDRYEFEIGEGLGPIAEPNELDLVEYQVTGPSSEWRVVVKGPIRDRAALEESVLRLLGRIPPENEAN
jgi:transcriptional regulator with XRE-family HTH domain